MLLLNIRKLPINNLLLLKKNQRLFSCCSVINQPNNTLLQRKAKKSIELKQFRMLSENIILDPNIKSKVLNTGIFKYISESPPIEFVQNSLVDFHSYTGLPWWGTIICSTLLLRFFITLPLAIYQQYIIARIELLKYEMNDIVQELKKETSLAVKLYKWDEKTARRAYNRSLRSQWNKLIVRDNCHPFKTVLLMLVQIPLWISLTMGLRNLIYMQPIQDFNSEMIFNQLSVEGVAWLSNLTQLDPYFILPIAFSALNLSIIELSVLSKVQVPSKLQKIMTNVFRGFTIIIIPVCSSLPSGLLLYWTTSSMFGLAQNLILISPKVRRICRIPLTPSELEQPYKQLAVALKTKLKLNKD